MPLEDGNRLPDELASGADVRLVQPQPDGDEAHTRTPLGHLVTCSRCIVDHLAKDRLGCLQLAPLDQRGGQLDSHLSLRWILLRDQARRPPEQLDRGGRVAAIGRALSGGP